MWPISVRDQKILNGIIANQNFAHAYLLSGSKDVFLTQVADYLKYGIFCTDFKPEYGPCLKCSNCNKLSTGNLVDSIVLKGKESIKIDTIRELKQQLKYGPAVDSHLVVSIFNAEFMTTEAANAFLKTLEEPVKGVMFILSTYQIYDILPTIKSRSQCLEFSPISDEKLAGFLQFRFGDQAQKIRENCFYSNVLMNYYLSNEEFLSPEEYMTYPSFIQQPPFDRLAFAERLSKSKEKAKLLLLCWVQQLIENGSQLKTESIRHLELIIENIAQMKYNLNLRLHLENLFIQL